MNTNQIARYVWLGRKDQRWYLFQNDLFKQAYGGDPARITLVTKLFAATSINTSLKSNVTLFRRALHEIDNGLPIGKYLPNIQQQLQQIRNGTGLTGRKISSFASALAGDPNAVVVDIWLLRAFGLDKKYFRKDPDKKLYVTNVSFNELTFDNGVVTAFPEHTKVVEIPQGRMRSGGATDKQYTLIESYVREESKHMGLKPCELSAMIWSGCRIFHSGDTQTRYTEVLLQQLYNMFEI